MEKTNFSTKYINKIDYKFITFCLFALFSFTLFALDESPLIFELKVLSINYSFSIAGIFGLLAAFTYGFYLSGKYRESESTFKHSKFAMGITAYVLLAYLLGFTLFSFFNGN